MSALFGAIPQIANVVFVCILFYLIFGIVTTQFLKGTFCSCNGAFYSGGLFNGGGSLTPAQVRGAMFQPRVLVSNARVKLPLTLIRAGLKINRYMCS